jgi:small conductance mechanosensitive channel
MPVQTPVQTLILDLAIRYGFQVLGAFVLLLVGFMVGRWIGAAVDRRLERQRMEPPMRMLITRALRIVVMLLALVMALDRFGFQIAPLVAGIGVAGLGIGIAMQGVLSNLVAGLSIIFTKPFRVGEHIAVAGAHGDVVSIDLFSTVLVHPDRSHVIVPNRKIVGEILHNFGTTRQLTISMVVAQDADLGLVLAQTRDVVASNARVLKDPPPAVGITQVSDGGIKVAAAPWVSAADVGPAEAELYQALVERFRARGIAAPIPRHDVRLLDGVGVGGR